MKHIYKHLYNSILKGMKKVLFPIIAGIVIIAFGLYILQSLDTDNESYLEQENIEKEIEDLERDILETKDLYEQLEEVTTKEI